MAKIGYGYGSEWHLLRYLGRHRRRLNAEIQRVIPATTVEWLDFRFGAASPCYDTEIVRLDFLPANSDARQAWPSAWPTTGTPINWDGVAELTTASGKEWLLVEAKANIRELASDCGAAEEGGRPLIEETIKKTKAALGAPAAADWLTEVYQAANRIAALHHLVLHGERAHLLFLYFCGDRGDATRTCPAQPSEWEAALRRQDELLGLPRQHMLADRIHRLFLDVRCRSAY